MCRNLVDIENYVDQKMENLDIPSDKYFDFILYIFQIIFYFEVVYEKNKEFSRKLVNGLYFLNKYILPHGLIWSGDSVKSIESMEDIIKTDEQFNDIIKFSFLCDIIPEVRSKKLFETVSDEFISIKFKDKETGFHELDDIIISELSQPFSCPPQKSTKYLSNILSYIEKNSGNINIFDFISNVFEYKYKKCEENIKQSQIITNENYVKAFGFSYDIFKKIQISIIALCQITVDMAIMNFHYCNKKSIEFTKSEQYKYAFQVIDRTFFIGRLSELSNCETEEIESFLQFFEYRDSDDKSPFLHSHVDFFPPFIATENNITFSPFLVSSFVHPRSFIKILSITPKYESFFSKEVSRDYENLMINDMRNSFGRIKKFKVYTNIYYEVGDFSESDGEIDFLCVDEERKKIFLAEVKGPLPPQGERQVRRLTTRINEGISQLDIIYNADREKVLKFISLKTEIQMDKNYEIIFAIISRSCFGNSDLHEKKYINPYTLSILQLSLGKMIFQNKDFSLLGSIASDMVCECKIETDARIEEREFTVNGRILKVERVAYDYDKLYKYRNRINLCTRT